MKGMIEFEKISAAAAPVSAVMRELNARLAPVRAAISAALRTFRPPAGQKSITEIHNQQFRNLYADKL
jgi:hypothetical protein